MLVSELIDELRQAASDAIVTSHIDHDIYLEAHEWSRVIDFEGMGMVLSKGYNGREASRDVCLSGYGRGGVAWTTYFAVLNGIDVSSRRRK
ncbi:MAG: hypothetical protein HFJ80_06480 [Clostridiales bacterium]|nr:hypothetical protein [Clostridiales bacterium]